MADGSRVRHQTGRIEGLDGLRAIAVLAVLIFHLRSQTLPGGFLGVDVFFVLSGFLITTLLIRELRSHGRLNLPSFWLRRARRLIPAIALVVLVTVPAAALTEGDLLVHIGRQVLGALTFSNNWLEISAGSSYFSQTAPQLFVNFWSLAVEEQFYLFWPIALAIILALVPSSRHRIAIALGLAGASALLMGLLVSPGQDATRVYYGTDTHLFGLMIGVGLAFFWSSPEGSLLTEQRWARWRTPASLAMLAGLAGLMFGLRESTVLTFRGGILLGSLLTAGLIACLLAGPSPLRSVLELRPVVWVGERSYGIYLWHWPVILIVTEALPATVPDSRLSWFGRALALAVTLAVSAASYRWLEVPVRRLGFAGALREFAGGLRQSWPRARVPKIAAATTLLLVSACGVAIAAAPDKSSVQRQIEANEQLTARSTADSSPSHVTTPNPTGTAGSATETPTAAPSPTTERSGQPATSPSSGKPSAAKNESGTAAAKRSARVPTGRQITAFGDSLVVTSATGLADRFPGIMMDAKSNRQWPDGRAAVQQRLAEGTVRQAVILDFGTNGGIADRQTVRDVLDALGPDRMIVLVNLYGVSDWIPDANAALAEIASSYPNVIIADWHQTISAHPGMLQSDHVHPGIEGANLYADMVKESFAQLAERMADRGT
ncbi:acyltransferase family protein [Segeticoccus rhizosphaerae]|uniref:acyltransferase family protein n=1 Tax=Segeticoccus rhizosphaerae TaxID=1104777 RepID=UPI0010C0E26E|nr:acyltransferase family protein [Ornithinicoccus soli]